jgi:hypothetical protein
MIYKTGHKDYPSIETYTAFLSEDGVDSTQAAAYLARYANDIEFVRKANLIKAAFRGDASSKREKNE